MGSVSSSTGKFLRDGRIVFIEIASLSCDRIIILKKGKKR